jgi:hypothetical protein
MANLEEFTRSLSERIMQTGSQTEEPAKVRLTSGNLTMIWTDGNIRYLEADNHELIRMIYPAVRDREWLTIVPQVLSENIIRNEDSFRISRSCRYSSNEIDFVADYSIEGSSDNTITLVMEGIALSDFEKNRIGWCILHPIEGNAGEKCLIELKNGAFEQSFFPAEISPFQIFTGLKSMRWTRDSINCRLEFEGDVFETEDQRNWTDASFKTYSTPLGLPYPVRVEKDTRIYQKVVLSVRGNNGGRLVQDDRINVRLFPQETYKLPEIGVCRKTGEDYQLTENEIKILRTIRFDHYRIDIHLYRSGWQDVAEKASSESHDLGLPVEVALFFSVSYDYEIRSFIEWYREVKIMISSVLLYHISIPLIPDERAREIIRLLREVNPQINVATGTNANFAQLNRNRPGDSRNDSVCFSIHPQEHLSDNTTLIENLRSQAYTIVSASKFSGNKKITVSPVTIRRRFNANKTLQELEWPGPGIPPNIDSRQMSLFAACWTAISIKYLSESGADSISYFETTGENGIIQGDNDPGWPEYFFSFPGMIFPVYHVFKYILSNKHMTIIKSISAKPLEVDCLALSDGKQARIILVNFTNTTQSVFLECCSGLFRIRTLCTACFPEATVNIRWTGMQKEKVIKSQDTFEIEPYSVNFIEGWRKH